MLDAATTLHPDGSFDHAQGRATRPPALPSMQRAARADAGWEFPRGATLWLWHTFFRVLRHIFFLSFAPHRALALVLAARRQLPADSN
eukprot:3162630-Prymnesium_polylepis.1